MAIQKFTTLQLASNPRLAPIDEESVNFDVWEAEFKDVERTAGKLSDFEFTPTPGFLYVTTRAISSRVNANYDGWPPEELRDSFQTFIGRPVYVDHTNWDLERSRGVILDAKLYEHKLASGDEDVWVELLIEVDAQAFPKLATAILAGDIDAVSMGADVEYTICSVCSNKAHDILEYCGHIPQMKGRIVEDLDRKTGSRIKKLCYEDCYGVNFFEISFVFDPADESALISDVMLAKTADRTVPHMRHANEALNLYTARTGTSMMKVARISTPTFCTLCGDNDFNLTKQGAKCGFCGTIHQGDKTLMSLPTEVDTLRDELNCPQCGAEWDGMVCLNCGFELPPEGLGDPNTDPFGVQMPEGGPGEGAPEEEDDSEESDDGDIDDSKSQPEDDKSKSKDKKKDDSKSDKKDDSKDKDDSKSKSKSKSKDDSKKSDDKKSDDKAKNKDKKSAKEELRVSRFDDFQKEATLPVDPPYRQDTSPANSVPGYGEAIPGGTPVPGFENALEPAPAAPAEVRDLDAPDVQGPVGQSEVDVVSQPDGPVSEPPPGPSAGEALNGQSQQGKAASTEEKRAAFLRRRAEALRERASEFEKEAETVYQTDVRSLDEPPPVNVGADATVDPQSAVQQPEQLLLADTPDVINDGGETGAPSGPDFRERLVNQVNPFNDAALQGYAPVNQQVASVDVDAEEAERAAEQKEATRIAEAKAREDQRVSAAKTRVLRIANFVDERIAMGLSTPNDKFEEIAKFEGMDDATLDGFIQATREFKAKETRLASKRVRVSASEDSTGPVRMPSLGSTSRPVEVDDEPGDDYVAFL